MGEPRLELALADLAVASQAGRAGATGEHERCGDPVADAPRTDLGADLHDGPGKLVPGDVRQRDVGVVPHPAVPVAAAQPGGADLDDDAGGRAGGVGDRTHLCRLAEPVVDDRAHQLPSPLTLVIGTTRRSLLGVGVSLRPRVTGADRDGLDLVVDARSSWGVSGRAADSAEERRWVMWRVR